MLLAGWVASLALPVASAGDRFGLRHLDGTDLLAEGWLGPLMLQFGWFANPLLLLLLGIGLSTRLTASWMLQGSSILMGLLVLNTTFWSAVPDDAGNHRITARHAGYFL